MNENEKELHKISKKGDHEALKELLKTKININAVDDECFTPLMKAVKNNNYGCVEVLVNSGANLNIVNSNAQTALNIAKDKNFSDIISLLKAKDALELNEMESLYDKKTQINKSTIPIVLGIGIPIAIILGLLVYFIEVLLLFLAGSTSSLYLKLILWSTNIVPSILAGLALFGIIYEIFDRTKTFSQGLGGTSIVLLAILTYFSYLLSPRFIPGIETKIGLFLKIITAIFICIPIAPFIMDAFGDLFICRKCNGVLKDLHTKFIPLLYIEKLLTLLKNNSFEILTNIEFSINKGGENSECSSKTGTLSLKYCDNCRIGYLTLELYDSSDLDIKLIYSSEINETNMKLMGIEVPRKPNRADKYLEA